MRLPYFPPSKLLLQKSIDDRGDVDGCFLLWVVTGVAADGHFGVGVPGEKGLFSDRRGERLHVELANDDEHGRGVAFHLVEKALAGQTLQIAGLGFFAAGRAGLPDFEIEPFPAQPVAGQDVEGLGQGVVVGNRIGDDGQTLGRKSQAGRGNRRIEDSRFDALATV